jgi:hypothetical protein
MMKSAIETAHTPPKAAPTTAARGIELLLGLADSDELSVACDAPTAVGLDDDKWIWLDPSETKLGAGRSEDGEEIMVVEGAVDPVGVMPKPVIIGALAPDEDTTMLVNVEVTPCTTDVTI